MSAQAHAHSKRAPNLLGIALIVITGLKVSRFSSLADKVAWGVAVSLSISCFASYIALRSEPNGTRAESIADMAFLAGLAALLGAVLIVALQSA